MLSHAGVCCPLFAAALLWPNGSFASAPDDHHFTVPHACVMLCRAVPCCAALHFDLVGALGAHLVASFSWTTAIVQDQQHHQNLPSHFGIHAMLCCAVLPCAGAGDMFLGIR
jgi:hypothetical protein